MLLSLLLMLTSMLDVSDVSMLYADAAMIFTLRYFINILRATQDIYITAILHIVDY